MLSWCRLEVVGNPSASNFLVFNGDFVDRGAWCAAGCLPHLLLLPLPRRSLQPCSLLQPRGLLRHLLPQKMC